MKFDVALFAYHREKHGGTISVESDPNVSSVLASLSAKGLNVNHSRLAIDEEFATGSEVLNARVQGWPLIPPLVGLIFPARFDDLRKSLKQLLVGFIKGPNRVSIDIDLPQDFFAALDEHHNFASSLQTTGQVVLQLPYVLNNLVAVFGNCCSADASTHRYVRVIRGRAQKGIKDEGFALQPVDTGPVIGRNRIQHFHR